MNLPPTREKKRRFWSLIKIGLSTWEAASGSDVAPKPRLLVSTIAPRS